MILFPNGIQGLSDTKWSGVRGSANKLVGIDYRSEPGAIKAHQKMTKFSPSSGGNQVNELCKIGLPLSDGSTLWFSSQSGKIWRELAGAFTAIPAIVIDPYLIKTAVDASKSFLPTEDSQMMGIAFKSDGTKMYLMGFSSDDVFQYTLSTAWDLSTAVYDTVSFSATTEDASPRGMAFKSDGTAFYLSGDVNNAVFQYTLSSAWDLSTASYASKTISVATQATSPRGISFSSDGTKMYVADADTDAIYQYTLSVAWDVSTATYASKTLNISTQATDVQGMTFNDLGTKVFVSSGAVIYGYDLSVAWDISTGVYNGDLFTNVDSGATSKNINAIHLAPNGIDLYFTTVNTSGMFQYYLAEEDLNVTVLSALEFSVPDGTDGDDEDVLNDELTQYVYFATKNWLFRIVVADITDWTKFEYLTLFKYGDDTYHPMKVANNRLFIGDRYCLAQVDEAGVITLESDLNVSEPERITILHNFDVDLLVGTKRLDEKSRILRWDTESETWYGEDIIYEGEIHAFLDEDNYTYAIVGDFGNLHYYDGEKLLKHIRIPGAYNNAAKCKVNANAVGYFMGVPIFGVSNITGNPTLQGIYSYGQYSKDYNITLDLSFPISSGEFAGLEIGAIIVRGTDVYAAWKSGTAVGIDKLDWTAKYNGAYIETMVLNNAEDRSKFKSFDRAAADYIEIPDDTAVLMQYSLNYGTYVDFEQVNDDKLFQLRSKATVPEIGAMQLKFTFTCVANNSPKIENFHGDFQGEE